MSSPADDRIRRALIVQRELASLCEQVARLLLDTLDDLDRQGGEGDTAARRRIASDALERGRAARQLAQNLFEELGVERRKRKGPAPPEVSSERRRLGRAEDR